VRYFVKISNSRRYSPRLFKTLTEMRILEYDISRQITESDSPSSAW
jgi:hypothetical protein